MINRITILLLFIGVTWGQNDEELRKQVSLLQKKVDSLNKEMRYLRYDLDDLNLELEKQKRRSKKLTVDVGSKIDRYAKQQNKRNNFGPTKQELVQIFTDIQILSYKITERNYGIDYNIDILYSGPMVEENIRGFVKNLHGSYNELNSSIWLTKQSYLDNKSAVYNGSISRGLLIVGKKSKFRELNYYKWMQEIGEFGSLFGSKENL